MAVQIVMDRTGDTKHQFNSGDARAVAEAEERFMLRKRCLSPVSRAANVPAGLGPRSAHLV
jgi:hypothetical protein